ncbi:hypothetical protein Sjap_004223 [Stephania japonica]|uniref:Uncharacterized protein n=1 Tax=Stephania japonica TaxID=461633 RepID=A0AAP0K2X2_9MAGN
METGSSSHEAEDRPVDDKRKRSLKQRLGLPNGNRRSYPILGGRLHFVKFETTKINECLDFINSKQLHRGGIDPRGWRANTSVNDDAIIKVADDAQGRGILDELEADGVDTSYLVVLEMLREEKSEIVADLLIVFHAFKMQPESCD